MTETLQELLQEFKETFMQVDAHGKAMLREGMEAHAVYFLRSYYKRLGAHWKAKEEFGSERFEAVLDAMRGKKSESETNAILSSIWKDIKNLFDDISKGVKEEPEQLEENRQALSAAMVGVRPRGMVLSYLGYLQRASADKQLDFIERCDPDRPPDDIPFHSRDALGKNAIEELTKLQDAAFRDYVTYRKPELDDAKRDAAAERLKKEFEDDEKRMQTITFAGRQVKIYLFPPIAPTPPIPSGPIEALHIPKISSGPIGVSLSQYQELVDQLRGIPARIRAYQDLIASASPHEGERDLYNAVYTHALVGAYCERLGGLKAAIESGSKASAASANNAIKIITDIVNEYSRQISGIRSAVTSQSKPSLMLYHTMQAALLVAAGSTKIFSDLVDDLEKKKIDFKTEFETAKKAAGGGVSKSDKARKALGTALAAMQDYLGNTDKSYNESGKPRRLFTVMLGILPKLPPVAEKVVAAQVEAPPVPPAVIPAQ